jgi:hypothetical protein
MKFPIMALSRKITPFDSHAEIVYIDVYNFITASFCWVTFIPTVYGQAVCVVFPNQYSVHISRSVRILLIPVLLV